MYGWWEIDEIPYDRQVVAKRLYRWNRRSTDTWIRFLFERKMGQLMNGQMNESTDGCQESRKTSVSTDDWKVRRVDNQMVDEIDEGINIWMMI